MHDRHHRNGRRVRRNRLTQRPNHMSKQTKELYYLTESLKNLLALSVQSALIGGIFIAIGMGLMRIIYELG